MRVRLRVPLVAAVALLACPAAAAADAYDTPGPTGPAAVQPAPPSPGPSISGTAQVGGVLTGSRGTWPNAQTSSEWLRCNVGASTCAKTGDTDLSYTVTAADVGLVIKLRVTGTRTVLLVTGTRTVDATTATIPPIPQAGQLFAPANATPPSVRGTARVGQSLSAATGTWVGTDPITYSYAWASCGGSSCRQVATGPTYLVRATDLGRVILLGVTARNVAGASGAFAKTGTVARATSALKRLSPFPTVLIDGRVSGATTRISTLRLRRVPGGATINAACSGRGCPFRKSTVKVRKGKSRTVALPRLQRRMRAGTTVVITVRKGDTLGKYVRLRFRKRSAPARVDRCVAPKSSKPVKCP